MVISLAHGWGLGVVLQKEGLSCGFNDRLHNLTIFGVHSPIYIWCARFFITIAVSQGYFLITRGMIWLTIAMLRTNKHSLVFTVVFICFVPMGLDSAPVTRNPHHFINLVSSTCRPILLVQHCQPVFTNYSINAEIRIRAIHLNYDSCHEK